VSLPPLELNRLIQLAQAGDERAFAHLYEAHIDLIYRYVAYRVPVEDAEDLTAEVFLTMVEGLPGYQLTEAPFEAWLYRIAAARVADYHRRAKRRPEVELTDTLAESEDIPEEALLLRQESDELRRALGQLSEDYQNVLLLRFVNQLSHEEVARMLSKSVTAVKSIQHRALTQLANLIGTEKQSRHYLRGRNG
jgi:RNA polymerase sigma-70 factor (ECF subfamily)